MAVEEKLVNKTTSNLLSITLPDCPRIQVDGSIKETKVKKFDLRDNHYNCNDELFLSDMMISFRHRIEKVASSKRVRSLIEFKQSEKKKNIKIL